MKKILVALLVAVILVSPVLAVQKRASVKVDIFSTLLGITSLEGNYAVTDKIAVPVGLQMFKLSSGNSSLSITGLQTGIRWYWQGDAVNKWYLEPLIGFLNINVTEEIGGSTGSASISSTIMSVTLGYQSIWGSSVTLDFGFGMAMYNIPSVTVTVPGYGSMQSSSISATLPSLKFSIGYAFDM